MSRTFVHFTSNLPVHSPEPKELHFSPGHVRKTQDGPINWGKSSDAAFWPAMGKIPKEGVPSFALQRSFDLMDCLHEMRRLKRDAPPSDKDQPPTVSSAAGEAPDEDEDMGLDGSEAIVFAVLSDLEDNEASLRFAEESLSEQQEVAERLSGKRHPTALLCARSLMVIRRKMSLLHDVEERTADF